MSKNYTKQKKILISLLIGSVMVTGLAFGWNFNFINSLIQRGSFAIADSIISAGYGCGTYGQTAPTYGGACLASVTTSSSSSTTISVSSSTTTSTPSISSSSSVITNTSVSSSSTSAATSVSSNSSTTTSTSSALSNNTTSVSSSSSISSSSISNYSSIPTPSTILNLRVLLSGAYDSTSGLMKTNLRQNNLVPFAQPYNTFPVTSPNYYGGGESVAGGQSAIPIDVVDWILLEIKGSAANNSVYKKAFMLDNVGRIFDPTDYNQLVNGNRSGITLPSTFVPGSYNIVVRHRNHLAISNDTPISLTIGTNNINYTANANVKSSNQTSLTRTYNNITTIVYGMISGNSNGDTTISALDRNLTRLTPESNPVYNNSDLNMDSFVSSLDRNIVRLAGEVTEDVR